MITVTLIPILSDNYAYLIEGSDGSVAVVDPGEAAPIIKVLDAKGVKPNMVLITHYHGDHVAGLDDLLAWHECAVIGKNHQDKHEFTFGGEAVRVIQTPGHKRDHVCFYFEGSKAVFSGDVLFAMGCGRLLDGNAQEMFTSLQKLAALPDDCDVYCGHEYTLSNAKFCAHIAPDNADIQDRLQRIQAQRDAGKPTIPTTIGKEKATNLFMQTKSAAEFAALRDQKDNY